MKYKNPDFMSAVTTPIEGEIAFRNYAESTFGPNYIIVGIDEVGRGPLAGPVVACAAVLKSADILSVLNDSKKFTRPKREAIYDKVKDACECYAIASASVEEIDRLNILEADFLAMRRALQALGMTEITEKQPELPVEVRGHFKPGATLPRSSVIAIWTAWLRNIRVTALKNMLATALRHTWPPFASRAFRRCTARRSIRKDCRK